MKQEALAFFRLLPAGTADIGPEVTREELRAAGAGHWSLIERVADDVSRDLPEGYDQVLPLTENAPAPGEKVVVLRFASGG